MNVHHLELFCHVARHGGISAAVRRIPQGIQQPALSIQLQQLEKQLGVQLFHRRPFHLTAEGQRLYSHIRPFFEQLDALEASFRHRGGNTVRIGAAEIVLRDHLPAVLRRVKKVHPGLRLATREATPAHLEAHLRDGELDFVISVAEQTRPPPGLRSVGLVRLPFVLQVHRRSKIKSAAELLARRPINEPLISCVPAPHSVFARTLQRLGLKWSPAIETNTLDLVTWYVAHGHGVGVNLALPELVRHRDVRVLPLEGFDPVELIALWRDEATPMLRTLIAECRSYGRENWPQYADDHTPQRGRRV